MTRFSLAAALAAALLLQLPGSASAQAPRPYEINVVLPITGGASFVGKGQQDSLSALEATVNKQGGIQGRPVKFLFRDDQTSPQVAVQLLTDIISAKPTVVIGSGLVAMCNAMAPLVKTGPVMYCMSPGFHPQPGSYAFSASSSSVDQIAALIRYYR